MNKYNIDSSAGKDSIENALGTLVYVAIGGIYAGCIVISDVIKPTSQQAIAALKNDYIKAYVQPKVDMHNGHIIGGEALVRWQNDKEMICRMLCFRRV